VFSLGVILKMEVVVSCETLVLTHHTIFCHIPEFCHVVFVNVFVVHQHIKYHLHSSYVCLFEAKS